MAPETSPGITLPSVGAEQAVAGPPSIAANKSDDGTFDGPDKAAPTEENQAAVKTQLCPGAKLPVVETLITELAEAVPFA
jgi:hypothetical protein